MLPESSVGLRSGWRLAHWKQLSRLFEKSLLAVPLGGLLQLVHCLVDVGLVHDVVAIEHRPGLVSTYSHRKFSRLRDTEGMLAGRQVEIHTERDRKLEAARQQRQSRRQQGA